MKKWMVVLMLIASTCPVLAEERTADDIHVSISENANGSHIINGGFSISASTGVAWDVLTDYDRMTEFVSSVKSSRRVERGTDNEIVEQVMSGKAGLFHKRIYLLLKITERPAEKIIFEDVSKKSFKTYAGSWEISLSDDRLRVDYQLEARPDFFSPDFIAVKSFRKTVKTLLTEVRAEISAREALKKS